MAPRPNAPPVRLASDDSATVSAAPAGGAFAVGVGVGGGGVGEAEKTASEAPAAASACPPRISAHLLSRLSRPGSRGADAPPAARLTSAVEIRSAQQFVCVVEVELLGKNPARGCADGDVGPDRCVCADGSSDGEDDDDDDDGRDRFLSALRSGGGRLVVREWRGSARWWNLNSNGGGGLGSHADGRAAAVDMARREVAGYRVARMALRGGGGGGGGGGEVEIPEVLHFSHDRDGGDPPTAEGGAPWAIFSYVGEFGSRFRPSAPRRPECPPSSSSSSRRRGWVHDGDFSPSMVKVRREFGFDEPHPRHGRVDVPRALEYGTEVLERAVLPAQGAFFDGRLGGRETTGAAEGEEGETKMSLRRELLRLGRPPPDGGGGTGGGDLFALRPYRYGDMVDLYEAATSRVAEAIRSNGDDNTDVADGGGSDGGGDNGSNGGGAGDMAVLSSVLSECVSALRVEAAELDGGGEGVDPPLPATLCHMDLQPQNMILRRPPGGEDDPRAVPLVASVLDWEEACLADPRFEILLMCRKVLANREQADALWGRYSEALLGRHGLVAGPLEPWLRLEGVHSVVTLALQGLDLAGGGRSPWEGRPDLWGKIERELTRLRGLGWEFCGRALGEDLERDDDGGGGDGTKT